MKTALTLNTDGTSGTDLTQKNLRINNLPAEQCGTLTGKFYTDFYGCWWSYIQDINDHEYWIIGDYPNVPVNFNHHTIKW